MHKVEISGKEFWDEAKERFIVTKPTTLILEHSLCSLYDWESKYKKPLIGNKGLTSEQMLDYVRFMTIGKVKDDIIYYSLTSNQIQEIKEYMEDSQTASWFTEQQNKRGGRAITAELIYYWMSEFNIPYIPCQRWHLNRLLTLIKVCSAERQGPKKMSRNEALEQQRRINQVRRAKYNSKG